MNKLLSIAAAVACFAGQARAGFQGVVTVQGDATGTFEGRAFTEALVTFTGVYDTDNVLTAINPVTEAFRSRVLAVASVSVDGIGSADFASSPVAVSTFSADRFGVLIPTELAFGFVDGGFANPFADFDLAQSFGPVQINFLPPPLPLGTVQTSEGNLTITGLSVPDTRSWFFENTVTTQPVPAPPSLVLAALGGVGLLLVRRRRS